MTIPWTVALLLGALLVAALGVSYWRHVERSRRPPRCPKCYHTVHGSGPLKCCQALVTDWAMPYGRGAYGVTTCCCGLDD